MMKTSSATYCGVINTALRVGVCPDNRASTIRQFSPDLSLSHQQLASVCLGGSRGLVANDTSERDSLLYQLPNLEELTVWRQLSSLSKRGLYKVLGSFPYLDCVVFYRFLQNPVFDQYPTLLNEILETAFHLSEFGVKGFEIPFSMVPANNQGDFQSSPNSFLDERSYGSARRILGMAEEYRQALRYAREPHVNEVRLGKNESIDWSRLTSDERHHLDHIILKHMPDAYRRSYDQQNQVTVDFVYTDQQGSRFVVEVKSYVGGLPPAQSDLARLSFIEAMRLSLVARQNGYEGVEYVIECGHRSGSGFVNGLEYALKAMGVGYRIRVVLR